MKILVPFDSDLLKSKFGVFNNLNFSIKRVKL